MVVPQYVVSWIEVGGLVVSLYGFFYISMDVFGKESVDRFRPLLPAGGFAILWALIFSALGVEFIMAVVVAVFVGVGTYRLAWKLRKPADIPKENVWELVKYVVVQSTLFATLETAVVSSDVHPQLDFQRAALLFGFCFVTFAAQLPLMRLVRLLSSERLRVLGFVLSVLGLLTAFLPAVLDVAGVTILQANVH